MNAAAQAAVVAFQCDRCACSIPLAATAPQTDLLCSACQRSFPVVDGIVAIGNVDTREDYPEEAYSLLAEVEPRHFWFTQRNRLILATLTDAIGTVAGQSVLDVGCGTGFVLAAMERAGLVGCGLDMHFQGLRYARRRTSAPLLCTSAARVPFQRQFDVALLCDVIEHTPDDVAVLRGVAEAVKPGGAVLVTVPAHPSLWSSVDEASGHYRRYSRDGLASAMAQAGLTVHLVRHFNTLLLPMQAAQRLVLRSRPVGTPEERARLIRQSLRIPPAFANSVLGTITGAEMALRRLPLRLGTSLIAVGHTG